ncbi:DUF2155 domain-containing protein [Primorskyibacter sp. S187A]|uniref:DUF2155 domain-containing protein n=1 Tax=Primorskyibacter sp. S187A TaxID=3415130 RepID=UPI003C7D1060
MRLCALICAGLLATAAAAQTPTTKGTGAVLRTLDKVSGKVTDLTVPNGGATQVGRLTVALGECRYPPGNLQGEAYAWIDVLEPDRNRVFSGWMIASSPALNAMDHPRYDVWVLRCSNS